MIEDFREYPENASIHADICIIGAGAAGITIANELANSSLQVCVVESGGFEYEFDTQDLYQVENIGIARYPAIAMRLRYFGGTTNHWDGRCSPLNKIDFEQRSWVPYSGWPITSNDLEPFYRRAVAICDLGDFNYGSGVLDEFDIPNPELDPEKLDCQVWKFSPPTRFGGKYREILDKSYNIKVLLHANVTNIQACAAATCIEHVDISTLAGKKGKIIAKRFILCCGGIENARILLLSNSVQKQGLGNNYDLVGRFFMEHLRSKDTVVFLKDPYSIKRIFNHYENNTGKYLLGLRMSEAAQKSEQVLNAGAMTYFEGSQDSATHSAANIYDKLKHQQAGNGINKDILNVISDLDELIVNMRRKFLRPGSSTLINNMTVMVTETEQAPNPSSRISLSSQRDSLGLHLTKIDWRLTELDRSTTAVMTRLLASELGRLYKARVRIPDWKGQFTGGWQEHFKDVAHHMGTTRMADNPEIGVVDQNCKVHGIDNLFIAGSSVFPTSGHVNPTMTIVALALRLADYIKRTSTS
jgi:choline dehydrogenase-like flavoprotein